VPRSLARRRPTSLALAAAALVLVLAACGGDDDDGAAAAPTPDASATEVTLNLVAFKPADVEIAVGETVTWVHDDAPTHTVTSGEVTDGGAGVTAEPDGRFDSGDLASGDTFEHTFDEAGTYPYFCEVHPATMRGVVTVD
jgi:plastocyanin